MTNQPDGVARKDGTARKVSFTAAARILAGRDPVIARLVAETGLPRLGRVTETHLGTLVRAIVYQQLAGRAAAAIHGRLVAALGGEVTPERMLALPAGTLRSAGLSGSKAASVQDLAAKVLDGTVVLDPPGLRAESDADMIARLSSVRGIGAWTAQMFLLFQLRRLDVWPTGDLGVRKGYGLAWGIPTPIAVLAGFVVGGLCGLLNGFLVAVMKLPPFIVTLGTWNIVMATNFIYSANETIRDTDVDEQAPTLVVVEAGALAGQ